MCKSVLRSTHQPIGASLDTHLLHIQKVYSCHLCQSATQVVMLEGWELYPAGGNFRVPSLITRDSWYITICLALEVKLVDLEGFKSNTRKDRVWRIQWVGKFIHLMILTTNWKNYITCTYTYALTTGISISYVHFIFENHNWRGVHIKHVSVAPQHQNILLCTDPQGIAMATLDLHAEPYAFGGNCWK